MYIINFIVLLGCLHTQKKCETMWQVIYFILRVRVYDPFPEIIVPIIREQSLGHFQRPRQDQPMKYLSFARNLRFMRTLNYRDV